MENLSNRNVFVVEDNPFYAAILKKELSTFCNNITVFASGEECIENMSLRPDVVLLDQHLSGDMKGIDVLIKIKEHNEQLPVVFISGNSTINIVKDALRLGASGFIDKSETSISKLDRKLKNIFTLRSKEVEQKINKTAKRVTVITLILIVAAVLMLLYYSYLFSA